MSELPIADYDHLPVGTLEARARSLDAPGVEQLLAHERGHAARPQVVTLLERRLEALDAGEAERSPGDPDAPAPEVASGLAGGTDGASKASPATEGPPQNPPSQGVPTNPAQPRR